MKKVLLTGANGFIGQHCLAPLLTKGYEIHAVSSQTKADQSSDIIWHCLDLLDLGKIDALLAKVQATHLLHLAWTTTPGKYWTSPENILWLQSSLALLQSFAKHGGGRVVIAGTCAEYDWSHGICKEHVTPLSPATLYGGSKHALQIMVDVFSKQHGLSSAWGRLFHLYGPYEHPERLVSSVIRSLLKNQPARCSAGNQVRDFLFVADAATAFVTLLENDVNGAVNIASGKPLRIKEVIFKIADRLGCSELVKLGERPDNRSDPPLLVADLSRLLKETSWSPEFDLDQGLDRTITWWKNKR